MTSQPIRDQVEDHLLTPKNAALLIIDYQPPQVSSIVSMDHRILIANIVATARLAKLYALPIVLSTVNVKASGSPPTIHQLTEVLAGIEELDRTTINAWEDEEFVTAVKAAGRKKLIMAALWTEACLSFPALDALREGYEIYPVVDAVADRLCYPPGPGSRQGSALLTPAGRMRPLWLRLVDDLLPKSFTKSAKFAPGPAFRLINSPRWRNPRKAR